MSSSIRLRLSTNSRQVPNGSLPAPSFAKRLGRHAGLGCVGVLCWLLGAPSAMAEPSPAPLAHPPNQLAVTVGVPFFDAWILNGDLTVDFRYGRKFFWFVPSVGGGFRQARFDPEFVPEAAQKKKLFAWQVSLGLRVEFPASDKLFPFIGLSAERSEWAYSVSTKSFCKDDFYPDFMRCYQGMDYQSGYGLKPIMGFVYHPMSDLGLEIWIERIRAVSQGMFTRSVTIYNPAVGMAWHF